MLVIFHTYCQEKKAKLKLQSEQIIHFVTDKMGCTPTHLSIIRANKSFFKLYKNSSFTECLFKEIFSYLVFSYLVFSSAVQIVFLVHLNEMVIFEETVSVSY